MSFNKYQHIEKLGTPETEGILDGIVYVFPKLDGTNCQVWRDENGIQAGSRNRILTEENDHFGFYKYIQNNDMIKILLLLNPDLRLYGEFLVPHTLKTYSDNAWRKFYVFDVTYRDDNGETRYIPYEEYQKQLELYNIDYIPPICKIENPTYERMIELLDKNTYLIKDGAGTGEGIVIKNYDYRNKFGRQTWAKIVRNDFKTEHHKNYSKLI